MSTNTQDRLRRALAQRAETTTTAPDAWRRIRADIEASERPPRRDVAWIVTAAAASVAVILAVTLPPGGGRPVTVAGGAGRLFLAPATSLANEGFHLVAADPDAPAEPWPGGVFRTFGRRASDGVALASSVVVMVPGDLALVGTDPEPGSPLPVIGQDVAVSTDHAGTRVLSWAQDDGKTVAVTTFGLSSAELSTLAESLRGADLATATPRLPAGFVTLRTGPLPGGTGPVAVQSWESDQGGGFVVTVAVVPGVTTDDIAWYLPGGRAQEVRGVTGVYSARRGAELMWIERPGTVVTVNGHDLDEKTLASIAAGLRPVSEQAWRELTAGVPRLGGPPPQVTVTAVVEPKALTADNRYFVIRPVLGRLMPPSCSQEAPDPSTADVVPETQDGRTVACLRLGSPALAADDVSRATARVGSNGDWEVEFALTKAGAARFEGLVQTAGDGNQIAVLVDGRVVSVPRLAPGAAPTRGVVNGLDEQTARHLAERLRS